MSSPPPAREASDEPTDGNSLYYYNLWMDARSENGELREELQHEREFSRAGATAFANKEAAYASHGNAQATEARLTREHTEVVARLEVMRAEVVGLRGAVTDDALVEVILTALIGEDDGEEGITHQITGKRSTIRKRARAVLAAVGPALVAAERERCAKIAEAAAWCDDMASAPRDKTLDLFNGKSRVPNCCFIDGRWGLLMNGYHIGVKPTHWRLPPAGPVT